MKFNCKSLLASFNVTAECPVGKAELLKRCAFVHNVNDPAGTEGPDSESLCSNSYCVSDFERSSIRDNAHPAQIELSPALESCDCSLINFRPDTELDPIVIEYVVRRRSSVRGADLGI